MKIMKYKQSIFSSLLTSTVIPILYIVIIYQTDNSGGDSIHGPPIAGRMGHLLTINCTLQAANIIWSFKPQWTPYDIIIPASNVNFTISPDGTILSILSLKPELAVLYSCQDKNFASSLMGFIVTTLDKVKCYDRNDLQNNATNNGDWINLRCHVNFYTISNSPIFPTLTLMDMNQTVIAQKVADGTSSNFSLVENIKLSIDDRTEHRFSCHINYSLTPPSYHDFCQFDLIRINHAVTRIWFINYQPGWQGNSSQLNQYFVGSNLTCESDGYPLPTFVWSDIYGNVIDNGSQNLMITANMVSSSPVTYTCNATNFVEGKYYSMSQDKTFSVVYPPGMGPAQNPYVLPGWAIALIVIACVVFLALMILLIACCIKNKNFPQKLASKPKKVANKVKGSGTKNGYPYTLANNTATGEPQAPATINGVNNNNKNSAIFKPNLELSKNQRAAGYSPVNINAGVVNNLSGMGAGALGLGGVGGLGTEMNSSGRGAMGLTPRSSEIPNGDNSITGKFNLPSKFTNPSRGSYEKLVNEPNINMDPKNNMGTVTSMNYNPASYSGDLRGTSGGGALGGISMNQYGMNMKQPHNISGGGNLGVGLGPQGVIFSNQGGMGNKVKGNYPPSDLGSLHGSEV